ncbi:PilZ domain-containing protein [Sphingomicrobium astaxanthinifaciens]|uniref:PilZ domain-containing protein n=1 Tax=Sphingomicrobium astaxanthinifaciens TaxID=1227949 RepID=UPI001FCC1E57|nr:PilZ domain-containing protein [Sphingomicrobium astaxanthinifaciens]MCJ7420543.1 PilZ domain-containing protein [Sphingomicrobium astaxanthinifaciens]
MKHFRERLRLPEPGNKRPVPLLRPAGEKRPTTREDDLLSVSIPRGESRWKNMREDERHRLKAEEAMVTTVDGERRVVELVNLSGGGAMIATDYAPDHFEPMFLDLGDGGEIEAAVRWVKGGRVGLQFVEETQIGCDAATRDNLLLDTIRKSFPDANIAGMAHGPSPFEKREGEEDETPRQPRSARRHPLIWRGHVHYDHDTHPVRLRNISETGAMIETRTSLPRGAGLLLDLDAAGTIFAHVSWSRGGQAGLHFETPFNVSKLAESKPQVASGWKQPDYLKRHEERARRDGDESPWSSHWDSPSVEALREELEGYLKY